MAVLTREIVREARGHGACAGETEILSDCSSQPCDLDCLWAQWTEEAACTKSCGGGTRRMRRNIVRNSSGNGLPCTGEAIRLDDCNDSLCSDVLAAIVVLSLLLVLAIIILGIVFYRKKFKLLDNEWIPKVSFNMPSIVKILK